MSLPPASSLPNSPGWSRLIERLRVATAGRFSIIRELGRGGFAAVFLAQQLQPNRLVAIKLLLPSHLDSQWALGHFRSESQKISSWRHHSVVTIYEVHEIGDLLFFVMNYVEGGSLHEVIASHGPLSVPMARSVLAQVGSALQYAHRQGVTHRDVKPQNVLIDTDGAAVVTDFGIAKQSDGTSHTATGMIFGTAPYMAPEQCDEGMTTFLSDQYALGILTYEMLTGSPPFTGSPPSVLLAHLQTPVPSMLLSRPDCPPELAAAIARMLEKIPANRFGSIMEAITAAGAQELSELHPDRVAFAAAARHIANDAQTIAIEIMTIPPVIEVGDRIPIEASARTDGGVPIDASALVWSNANRKVAEIDAEGRYLTAREPGYTTLMLQVGNLKQEVQIAVRAPHATSVRVSAPTQTLPVGGQVQCVATGTSKSGQPVTNAVQWRSSDTAIARVNEYGTVRGLRAGRVRIDAQIDEAVDELTLEVMDAVAANAPTPPLDRDPALARAASVTVLVLQDVVRVGDRIPMVATVRNAHGESMNRVPSWRLDDSSLASVDVYGTLLALSAGTVVVSATVDEVAGAAVVEIVPPTSSVSRAFASPSRFVAVAVVGAMMLAAVVFVVSRPTPPSRSPGAGAVVIADSSARVSTPPLQPDSASAPDSGSSAVRTDTVRRGTASRRRATNLRVTLATSTLEVGRTTALQANGSASGAAVPPAQLRVVVRDPTVATANNGVISGRNPGATWIVVTVGALADSVRLTVTAPKAGVVAAGASSGGVPATESPSAGGPAMGVPRVEHLRIGTVGTLEKGESRAIAVELILRGGNRSKDYASVLMVSSDTSVLVVRSDASGFRLEARSEGRARVRATAGTAAPVEWGVVVYPARR